MLLHDPLYDGLPEAFNDGSLWPSNTCAVIIVSFPSLMLFATANLTTFLVPIPYHPLLYVPDFTFPSTIRTSSFPMFQCCAITLVVLAATPLIMLSSPISVNNSCHQSASYFFHNDAQTVNKNEN